MDRFESTHQVTVYEFLHKRGNLIGRRSQETSLYAAFTCHVDNIGKASIVNIQELEWKIAGGLRG